MSGPSEKQIENQILNWLGWKNIYAWKVKTTATYSKRLGRFLKPDKLYRTGISDIIGILPNGRLLAIEVKSLKGRPQENQVVFMNEIKARGGLAFIARSVEDVEYHLESYTKHSGAV